MKEATGELNMTVVTVVAIAAIAAFFYVFVWPVIQGNISQSTQCANAICDCEAGAKICECVYVDNSNTEHTIKCAAKNESN